MRKIILFLFLLSSALYTKAQNIFPVKLDNCKTESFCLDCGDTPAGVDSLQFQQLADGLNQKFNFGKVNGKLLFQVLVDSLSHGCVLSHTDVSKSQVVKEIVNQFNSFGGWHPAVTKGKTEGRTSINVLVEFRDGVLSAKVQRVDDRAFMKSFDHPVKPEIFNSYKYKNEHLKDYEITVWNSANSNLPDNFNDDIAIDKNNTIWMTTEQSLVTFDGKSFTRAEQDITDRGKYFRYYALTIDNNNTKWVAGKGNIYSYDDKKWKLHDAEPVSLEKTYHINSSPATGEIFFGTSTGLKIYKAGKWTTIDTASVKELPRGGVSYAYRDKKGRLWIGTYGGSVMIDENEKVTAFNETKSVLKGKCITSADEDENGNLYFGLYEFNRKDKKVVNANEGIAILYAADGKLKQFNTSNSGMPFNHTTKVLYDKNEHVLWIATDRAGLARYDLKDTWENYHNENSKIPTAYVTNMAFDNNGVLYVTTRQGLVRLARK